MGYPSGYTTYTLAEDCAAGLGPTSAAQSVDAADINQAVTAASAFEVVLGLNVASGWPTVRDAILSHNHSGGASGATYTPASATVAASTPTATSATISASATTSVSATVGASATTSTSATLAASATTYGGTVASATVADSTPTATSATVSASATTSTSATLAASATTYSGTVASATVAASTPTSTSATIGASAVTSVSATVVPTQASATVAASTPTSTSATISASAVIATSATSATTSASAVSSASAVLATGMAVANLSDGSNVALRNAANAFTASGATTFQGSIGVMVASPLRRFHLFDAGVSAAARVYIEATPGLPGGALELAWDAVGTKRSMMRGEEIGASGAGMSWWVTNSIGGVVEAARLTEAGYLGVGTTTAAGCFHAVPALSSTAGYIADAYGATATESAVMALRSARGTAAAASGVLSGDRLGLIGFRGYTSAGAFSGSRAYVAAFAAENFTSTNQGADWTVYTTPIGSTTPALRLSLTANGNVIAGTQAALATNATDGFLYIPTCAGNPSGAPTAYTGKVPLVYDTTNKLLFLNFNNSATGWVAANSP